MELMQAVEHYATAMKLAERYGNKNGDVDAANNAWHECKKAADELRIGKEMLGRMMGEYAALRDENAKLREALETYACMSESMSRPAREALTTHNAEAHREAACGRSGGAEC